MSLEKLKKELQRFHLEKLEEKDFFVNNQTYTAADLIVRQYLNNGPNSGFGMIRIQEGYDYIVQNKEELISNNMLNKSAANSSGIKLWDNYKF